MPPAQHPGPKSVQIKLKLNIVECYKTNCTALIDVAADFHKLQSSQMFALCSLGQIFLNICSCKRVNAL
jgi:hypothetical protein